MKLLIKILILISILMIGFNVFQSDANFVYFKIPEKVKLSNFINHLETKNILIKGPFDKFPFNNHLRVTVGSENQMNLFCDVINEYLLSNNYLKL